MKFPAKLNDFRDYVHMFYGKDGVYDLGCGIPDIQDAIMEYLAVLLVDDNDMLWGDGDSIDRERVRYILEDRGFAEVANV